MNYTQEFKDSIIKRMLPPNNESILKIAKEEGFHIKRLGEEGPYSLNPDVPFTLTSPDDHVETIGRVLGIVDASVDFPSAEEGDLLRELCHEDIEEFREKYHLSTGRYFFRMVPVSRFSGFLPAGGLFL